MKRNKIRSFRGNLRRFERLNQLTNTTCCSGITVAQCHVLLEMEKLSETTTKELSERLKLDKSTLSRTVDGLKKKNLVKTKDHSHDKRFTILTLTKKGKDKCESLNKYNDGLYKIVFEEFSNEEINQFSDSFNKLIKALTKYCDEKKLF
jgi:DNA-binding MarR family transcriptional regulator